MTEFELLGLNRFGLKDPNQSSATKGAIYASVNPTPKQIDEWRKLGQGNKSNEEDRGAPNVMTGTVITNCFIQTSALPSRVEIAGNEISFYDDTYAKNGKIVGSTSRIFWTHDLNSNEGFYMEKRASVIDTYDNVFAFYALPPKTGKMNYMFFGRQGTASSNTYATNYIQLNVNHDTGSVTQSVANGAFVITGSTGGVSDANKGIPLFGVYHNSLVGVAGEGYSVYAGGRGTGGVYLTNVNLSGNTVFPNNLIWVSGTGSPEGVVTAPIGSLYSNLSGGASTTLYVKTSGTGNTGWTAK